MFFFLKTSGDGNCSEVVEFDRRNAGVGIWMKAVRRAWILIGPGPWLINKWS